MLSISMLTTILELDCGENPISAGGGQAKGVQDACQSVARQVAPSIACIQPARGTRRECRAPRARTRSRSGVSSARRSSGARAARRLKQRRGPPKSASSGGGHPRPPLARRDSRFYAARGICRACGAPGAVRGTRNTRRGALRRPGRGPLLLLLRRRAIALHAANAQPNGYEQCLCYGYT